MIAAISLSHDATMTAGILMLSIVAVEYGGTFVLKVVRGAHPMTPFQQAFARAGHAHAGVLVTLSLVVQILADAAAMTGVSGTLGRTAIPLAAILFPAGFFLSSAGRGATRPNRFIWLLYAGAVSLAAGALALGIGLLNA